VAEDIARVTLAGQAGHHLLERLANVRGAADGGGVVGRGIFSAEMR